MWDFGCAEPTEMLCLKAFWWLTHILTKSRISWKSMPKWTPKVIPKSTFGRSGVRLLRFLAVFWGMRFLISFGMCKKSTKNEKSSALGRKRQNPRIILGGSPDRPNVDFGMTFGVHLGIDFHEILDFVIICVNHPNALYISISVVFADCDKIEDFMKICAQMGCKSHPTIVIWAIRGSIFEFLGGRRGRGDPQAWKEW